MAADVVTSVGSIQFGTPKVVMNSRATPVNRYDVRADGKLFGVSQVGDDTLFLQLVTG